MGMTRGLVQSRSKFSQGFNAWRGWMAPEGSVAPEGGL